MSARLPNIVVFLADDLGWADLSCYGAEGVSTPRIDELAARGTRFVDCHAASAVCTPSRYGLLTGRYPWRSPLKAGVLGGADPSIIPVGMPTMASVLADLGYRTGAFGKWHLGLGWQLQDGTRADAFDGEFRADMQGDGRNIDYAQPFTGGPIELGFERFFGLAGSLDMPPYCFLDQDRTVGIPSIEKDPLITSQRPGLTVPGWRDDQVDVRIIEEAAAWLGQDDERPFFAYVATAAPHRPCVPPEFVRGTSKAGARGDSIHLFDWMVGQVVDSLSAEELANTLFLITSDNGAPMIFPEDGDVTTFPPNGHWRGQKADAYEGGHRVPLVCAGPGVPVQAPRDEPISLLDLLPTLSEVLGGPVVDTDGVPFSLGDTTAVSPAGGSDQPGASEGGNGERIIGVQAFDGRLVLRQGNQKAIYGSGSGGFSEPVGEPCGPDGDGQVYDLSEDPVESRNLWGEGVEIALHRSFVSTTGYNLN